MEERGVTYPEMLVVVTLILFGIGVAAPAIRAYSAEAHLVGAGRQFKVQFLKARSMAARSGAYTAIRFERDGERATYSIYSDGNWNGVRTADIRSGVDRLVEGPFPLTGGATDVRVGFNPGVPAVPPDSGSLYGDPIRFGATDLLSFSPLGTATPGTFYLAGDGAQAAVRVTPGSARVRLLICRGLRWIAR
jgi:hypothetical protein